LSQHLARLRADGLVTFRRESQTLYYRIADKRAARIVELLKDIYCGDMA
jgi:DNA-binding transcriptional ArsR family regulator